MKSAAEYLNCKLFNVRGMCGTLFQYFSASVGGMEHEYEEDIVLYKVMAQKVPDI